VLDAAMARRYSASPGNVLHRGGAHTFAIFKPEDNSKIFSVEDALHESVNLVFIPV